MAIFRLLPLLLFFAPALPAQSFDASPYGIHHDTLQVDTLIVNETMTNQYDGTTYTVRSRSYLIHSDTVPGMAVLLDTLTKRDDFGALVVHYGLRVVPGFAVRRSLFTDYFTATGDRIKPEDLYMFKPHE